MSSTPEFNAEQLTVARAKAWHQNGEPLLTLDAVRDWLSTTGLVLFAPRPLQLPMPAPSLVEAMLGAANVGPTAGQIDTARSLLARLVSEGNALPLNLLGIPGDVPDFIVSAQVFSFVFTLRGDKTWKQPPSTTGASKVSPLGVRVYEVLAEKGALSAAELANELGRELTEGAVLRTLNELWSHLRVIPLLQQGAAATLWELTSRRFTKAIKSGINAGQPTALSALISLYLSQSLLATEDEVETFLSPLAARSRLREVLHALTGSRQLETIVLDGKTLMHVPGTLPEFPAIEMPEPTEEEIAAAAASSAAKDEGEGRIKRFTPSADRRAHGDFKGKPARSFGAGAGTGARSPRSAPSRFGANTRASAPRFDVKPDRERRPFRRDAAASGAGAKPGFTRPWNEDRKPRSPRAEDDTAAPKRPYVRREGAAHGAKRPYTPRKGGSAGSGFAKRPYTPREGASSDRPARPFAGAKRTFGEKPAFRKASGDSFASKPRFAAKDGERKPFERKPFVRREGAAPSSGAKRGFGDKPTGSDSFSKFRKFDAPRKPFVRRDADAERPAYGGSDSKPRAPKVDRADSAPKRPFPRKEGDLADRPVRPWPESKPGRSDGRPGGYGSKRTVREHGQNDGPKRSSYGAKRTFDGKPAGGRPARPRSEGPAKGTFGSKPSGSFSKRPGGPGGKVPFDGKPSFGKRPAPAGGFKPVARNPRPETEE